MRLLLRQALVFSVLLIALSAKARHARKDEIYDSALHYREQGKLKLARSLLERHIPLLNSVSVQPYIMNCLDRYVKNKAIYSLHWKLTREAKNLLLKASYLVGKHQRSME